MLIEDSREKMSPQWHLLKAKSCVYRGTCASKSVTCPPKISRDARIYKTLTRTPKVIKKKKKKRCLKICKGEKIEIESLEPRSN